MPTADVRNDRVTNKGQTDSVITWRLQSLNPIDGDRLETTTENDDAYSRSVEELARKYLVDKLMGVSNERPCA